MSDIKFSRDELNSIIPKIKQHFIDEFDQEIGAFEAEFLVDFFAKKIGPFFYNRGLADAQVLFSDKAEELSYLLQDLEKPTP